MKKIIKLGLPVILFSIGIAHAQKCPTINLTSPDLIKEGDELVITANVRGGDANSSYTYNWSISAGAIKSGQGTPIIYVESKGLGGQTVTATVEIGGVDRSCSSTASTSTSVDAVPQTELHTKDDYSTAKAFTDDAGKFAGDFMSAYYSATTNKAVIFLYPGKNTNAAADVKKMGAIIKSSFAQFGMTPAMYQIKPAGKRAQTSYEMWIVPAGGEAPVATPVK